MTLAPRPCCLAPLPAVLLCCALLAQPLAAQDSSADTAKPVPQLSSRDAPLVLIGTAVALRTAGTAGIVTLHAEATVRGVGFSPGQEFALVQDMVIDHAPRLAIGDRALLFIEPVEEGRQYRFAATNPALVLLPEGTDIVRLAAETRRILELEPALRLGSSSSARLSALVELVATAVPAAANIALADLSLEDLLWERLSPSHRQALLARWEQLSPADPMSRPLALVLTAAREVRIAPRLQATVTDPAGCDLKAMAPHLLKQLDLAADSAALLAAKLDEPGVDRRSIIEALGILGDSSYVPRILLALDDKSLIVRREAVLALGALKDERAMPCLLELAMAPNDTTLARPAIAALARLDHPNAWNSLRAFAANHPDPELRRFAEQATRDPFGLRY